MKSIPMSLLIALLVSSLQATPEMKNVVIYQEDGRYAGWPANNGAWIFEGDEMLVGFTEAPFELRKGHNIGPEGTRTSWLARSKDGGQSWVAYDPEEYVGDFGLLPELKPLVIPIRFDAPLFAMRMVGTAYHGSTDPRGHFFYSYDGGDTWMGPHGFGDLINHPEMQKYGLSEMTPRTDYVVLGRHEALIMMSARIEGEFGTDRLFVLRTTDGGQSFFFMGWVVPPFGPDVVNPEATVPLFDDPSLNPHPSQARAVMPQSFLMADGTVVTAMRRRYKNEDLGLNRNWVDAYASRDRGRTWSFMATIGDAGTGNGNPPALSPTADGRLCAVFGDRAKGRILVTYSSDQGKTWSEPFVLRDDFGSEDMETNDLGYPRLLLRSDGKMVALYYYSTHENHHGIFATIWDPEEH
ncbi:MAG: hypothetical protein DRP71_08535 [Verrucomicrobia bacterium]|nr:MAG: hypothetical protein DRP71_08535 [Verrucomicrobiota bacterium]